MTGSEHYRAAEVLLGQLADESHAVAAAEIAAIAQVHATLALAAATAMGAPLDGEADSGLPQRDAEAWYEAAGTKPKPKGGADRG